MAYNAINHSRFSAVQVDRTAKRQSLGLKPDGPLIATIGRYTEQKGFRYFIQAAERLTRTRPDCQSVLMGTGEVLPQAVSSLLADPVRADSLSRAARVQSRRFSVDSVASQYQQLYRDLWE